jgi:polyphenol oxidase
MARRRSIPLDGGTVHTVLTDRSDGDLRVDADPGQLKARRAAVAAGSWTWLHQVHGAEVSEVGEPGGSVGERADAAVTAVPGAVLAVHTADCAGVLLWGTDDGRPVAVGAAHARWQGLLEGVLESTVEALRNLGSSRIHWTLGPCIAPASYEFGEQELGDLERRYGSALRSSSAAGRPALDLRRGVRAALGDLGATEEPDGPDRCTAEDPTLYSWRARRDTGRQAAVIWFESSGAVSQ